MRVAAGGSTLEVMRTSEGTDQADVLPPGAALTFGVLGPLEVRVGGSLWEVRGGRERMLLAMLLTAPGRVISVSALVAGLWGDEPPRGADKAVQTYVSRLRSSLPDHGAGLVLTRSPGYVAAVTPDQVDAEMFHHLAASGRRQLAAGRPSEAAATLREALDLWRGEAYMEFDAPFAAAARTALDEERVATLEDRIEADLALGSGPELVGELESLVSRHPWQERLWGQLMVALYRSGRQSDALLAFRRARCELRDELGVDPGPELRAVESMVLAHDPRLIAAPPDGTPLVEQDGGPTIPRQARAADAVCPFKGLAHYEVDDSPYFFGRAHLVDRLVTRLVDRPLLAVVGPSGSGKSSVLRAGLLASVRHGVLPGSQAWRVVLTHPAEPRPVLPVLPEGRTLMVVDALEEMFTGLTPEEQTSYAEWICEAAATPAVTVVVALRADYYGHLTAYPALADLVAADTVPVGPLSVDELREAVEGPLAKANLETETGLVELVVSEVAGQPGALPLLSSALLSLWEGRREGRLTLAAYHELGGVRSAVARLGERFYADLPPERRGAARRVLLRLGDTGAASQPVRRRASFAELGLDRDEDVRAIVDALAAGRLVTLSENHVELAHEALLREWPRLQAWWEDDEVGARLRRQLAPAAVEWDTSGRPASELYRGPRLASALDWLAEHPEDPTALETTFLRASEEAAEKEAGDRRRSVRRLRALAATLTAALVLAAVSGGVALSERNEARSSAEAAGAAELDADVRALRAQALAEPQMDRALLLAAQAYRLSASEASGSTMLEVAQRSPELAAIYRADQLLQHVAVASDGSRIAAVGAEGGVYVWNTATGELTTELSEVSYYGSASLDLSPDGRRLALVGLPVAEDPEDQVFEGQAIVIDLAARRPEARTIPGPALAAARFAADGRTLVQVGVDGRVRYVDVVTGRALPGRGRGIELSKDSAGESSIALEGPANRRFLVAAEQDSGGPVTVWATESGRVVWSERQDVGSVPAVSPDGRAVVLGHADGSLERVTLDDGRRRSVPAGLAGGVADLAWSPTANEFAGAAPDGTVTTWDARSLEPTRVLSGHAGGVTGIAYSADGKQLVAAGEDGSVLVWQLSGSSGLVQGVGGGATPRALGSVISGDGSIVATAMPGHVVRVFDVDRRAARRVDLEMPGGPAGLSLAPGGEYAAYLSAEWPDAAAAYVQVIDVAEGEQLPYTVDLEPTRAFDARFSGDGATLVTTDDSVVVAREVATGRRITGSERYRAQAPVAFLGVDQDGRRVALSGGGDVEVADMATGQQLVVLDPMPESDAAASYLQHLTFSPDGRWLAAGSDSGVVVVWDTGTWDEQARWRVSGGAAQSLAFTADSRSLVVGGGGAASIRDVANPRVPLATVDLDPLRTEAHVSVASREDGRVLVTHTDHSGVQLWRVAPEALLAHACRVAGRDLTPDEWDAALPDRAYAPTCGPS